MKEVRDEGNSNSRFHLLKQTLFNVDVELRELENELLDNHKRFKKFKRQREKNSQNVIEAAFKKQNMQVEQKYDVDLKQKELSQLQLSEQNVQREAELQSTLLKRGECETRCEDLQKHKIQLSNEALSTVQRFKSEMNEKQAKINELYAYISSLKAGEDHLQSELKALKEANEKLVAEKAEQDANARRELNKLDSQKAEQKRHLNEMEQQHLNITNKLSAEKSELAQQFGAFKEAQEKNLAEIESMLHRKQVDFVASFKSMQFTILQLKSRMTHMDNVFAEAVGSDSVSIREQNNHPANNLFDGLLTRPYSADLVGAGDTSSESISKIAAAIAASASVAPGVIKRRKLTKRRRYSKNNFELSTDTDDNTQRTN
ncbi:hypothetical protein ACLKA7_007315 [Drosophila subpalustris]